MFSNWTLTHLVGHCDLILLCTLFFIFKISNNKVPLIFHANFQLDISTGSGKEADFVSFAVFSNGSLMDIRPAPIYNSETLE